MLECLNKCKLCPHECNVNRIAGELGRCKASYKLKIALANLHYYEEPCISGENGSGTIFFTGCNMSCKFCQNYKISQEYKGNEIEIEELANKFLELQSLNANNINLVTGVIYIPQIIEAIKIAKREGLKIPIIYNSSGYEKLESIKLLKGFVDVYLPDFKYYNNELGKKISNIDNYFENVTKSILEMYNQVGSPILDSNGIIKKGLIIRHLILPNQIENSKKILYWIKENIDSDVYVSIMAQYFPTYKAVDDNMLNRKINNNEYNEIEQLVFKLDFKGYIQDLEDNEQQYVPNF